MRKTNKDKPSELIVLFGIFIVFVLILLHIINIGNEIIKYVNQPVYSETIAYHKCGGTKKQPIMCPIIVREEIHEDD